MKFKRNLKKIASLLLAVVMVLAMTVTGFAVETGSITINGASEENIYSVYKLLDLNGYNTGEGTYSYSINSAWSGFFAQDDIKTYIDYKDGVLTWMAGDALDKVAEFSKKALAYAKANGIQPVENSGNEIDSTDTIIYKYTTDTDPKKSKGVFSGLELGYYLVDSTMGALCGLTTTNPNASINAKNAAPTIDKQVQEDSTEQWGGSNTADIGQTVYFRTTINVHAGAENYVLHDKMSAGLTFDKITRIEHIRQGSTTVELTNDNEYSVETSANQDVCTFEVTFSKDFCDSLETNDKIIVYYQAMLNRNAVIAGEGNPNESWLEFGEQHFTAHDTTTTKTYGIDLIKTDDQNTLIDGAEFKIYDAQTEGNEVKVVLMDDGVTYRRARADETGITIVVKDGQVRITGFDNGTYYLEETKIPEGYNGLTTRQKFIISDANLDATFNDGIFSTGSGVHIVNRKGSMLPETGGIGTTIFYIIGGLMVFGAVVLMVTKKRMDSND